MISVSSTEFKSNVYWFRLWADYPPKNNLILLLPSTFSIISLWNNCLFLGAHLVEVIDCQQVPWWILLMGVALKLEIRSWQPLWNHNQQWITIAQIHQFLLGIWEAWTIPPNHFLYLLK